MPAPARLGLRYFLWMFGVGFLLGAPRTLWLEPRLGELASVLLEFPVILGVLWWVSGRLVRGTHPPPGPRTCLVAGGVAFALLLLAELALTTIAGGTAEEFLRDLLAPAGVLGLAGQVLAAAFPWFRRVRGRGSPFEG